MLARPGVPFHNTAIPIGIYAISRCRSSFCSLLRSNQYKPTMMKTQVKNGLITSLVVVATVITAVGSGWEPQQDMEVPGDHFSLEGALELFKKSKSPEEFERMLNSPDARVNNLDLNGDGDIDYIRVIDRNDRNVHAFILQAVISPDEFQDVAVIELEILADGKAVLQIVGDADIYGIETIIEPTEEVRVNAGATTVRRYVNVWSWPTVQYVYDPFYVSWESPWGWYSRPYWWNPWRPVTYVVYRPYWDPYRPYYSVCNTRRIHYAQVIYRPVRTTSVIVHERHHRQISYSRATRGRDSYYHDDRNRHDRGRDSYSNSRSGQSSGSRYEQPGSGGRSGGRTRYSNSTTVAPSRDEETKPVRIATPRPRTSQASEDVNLNSKPRVSFEQRDRSDWSRPKSNGNSGSGSRPSVNPRPANNPRPAVSQSSPGVQPRPSASPRPSVQPSQSGNRSSQRVDVQRSSSPQPRSQGSGSTGSGKRGRD